MMKTKITQKQVNTVMKKPIGSTGIHSTTAGSYEQGKKVLTSIETLTDKIHERTTITDTFSTESSGYFPIGKVVAMNLSTFRKDEHDDVPHPYRNVYDAVQLAETTGEIPLS